MCSVPLPSLNMWRIQLVSQPWAGDLLWLMSPQGSNDLWERERSSEAAFSDLPCPPLAAKPLWRWDLRTGEISWDAKTTHGQQLPWTMFWNSHVLLLFDKYTFMVWDIGKHNGVQGSWSWLNSCKARPHLEGLLPFSLPHLSFRKENCNILHLSHMSDRKRNMHGLEHDIVHRDSSSEKCLINWANGATLGNVYHVLCSNSSPTLDSLLHNALVLLKKSFPAQILVLGPHSFFNPQFLDQLEFYIFRWLSWSQTSCRCRVCLMNSFISGRQPKATDRRCS